MLTIALILAQILASIFFIPMDLALIPAHYRLRIVPSLMSNTVSIHVSPLPQTISTPIKVALVLVPSP